MVRGVMRWDCCPWGCVNARGAQDLYHFIHLSTGIERFQSVSQDEFNRFSQILFGVFGGFSLPVCSGNFRTEGDITAFPLPQ